MRFTVINSDGLAVMGTNYPECVPDEEELNVMAKGGFKFKIDGKAASVKRIVEIKKDWR